LVNAPQASQKDASVTHPGDEVQLHMSRPFPVRCAFPSCGEPAAYKIAAAWSDGQFSELKTYGHCCHAHLGPIFREAATRRGAAAAGAGETLDEIGIYRYEHGKRDRQLQRLWGLEENYRK
jgi:hypothetical protein